MDLERPDARKPLAYTLSALEDALAALEGTDVPPNPARLRGVEGAAARAYFQGLSALFPPALEFVGRNRRPPRDLVNACFSLAYTLLHFEAVRAAHMAGLDPCWGSITVPPWGENRSLRPHRTAAPPCRRLGVGNVPQPQPARGTLRQGRRVLTDDLMKKGLCAQNIARNE
jgi:hypothetical protein